MVVRILLRHDKGRSLVQNQKKTTEYLIYFLIVLFPVMTILEIKGSLINISISDFFLIPLALILILNFKKFNLSNFRYGIIYLIFFAVFVISGVHSLLNTRISSLGLSGTTLEGVKMIISGLYFYAGFLSFSSYESFKNILKAWILGLWLCIIFGYVKMIGFLLGYDIAINNTLGDNSRFLGTFTDSNLAGTYLSLSFFITVIFIIVSKERAYKLAGIFTLFITFLSILLTQSRGTLIGFVIALFLLVIINIKKIGKRYLYIIPLLLITFFTFLNIDQTYFDGLLYNRVERRFSDITDMDGELGVRLNLSVTSVLMGIDNPVFGVGKGNFRYNSKEYLEKIHKNNDDDYVINQSKARIPHNTFAGIFAELGLPGLIVFSWLFILLFIKLLRKKQGATLVLIIAFIALFVHSLSLSLENFRGLWIITGISFSLTNVDIPSYPANEKKNKLSLGKRNEVILVLLLTIIMIASYVSAAGKIRKETDFLKDPFVITIDDIDPKEEYTLFYDLQGNDISVDIFQINTNSEWLVDDHNYKNADGKANIVLDPSDDTSSYRIEFIAKEKAQTAVLRSAYYETSKSKIFLSSLKFVPDFIQTFFSNSRLIWFEDKSKYIEKIKQPKSDENGEISVIDVWTKVDQGNINVTIEFKTAVDISENITMILYVHTDNINNVPKYYDQKNTYTIRHTFEPPGEKWQKNEVYELTHIFKGKKDKYALTLELEGYRGTFRNAGIVEPDSLSLADYLDSIDENKIFIISVRDEGANAVDFKTIQALRRLGLYEDIRDKIRWSYLLVGSGSNQSAIYEKLSESRITAEFKKDEDGLPFSLILESSGYDHGNKSSIIIDGVEYSQNKRGFNIVLYDLKEAKVVSSVNFDTYISLYK